MAERSAQRNAADPRQIGTAGRLERRRASRRRDMFRRVMATPEGRFVMADLIRGTGVHRSIWDNSARIHYNSGRQDWGLELMATLQEVDADAYDLMEAERRALDRRDASEIEALHIANAPQEETEP